MGKGSNRRPSQISDQEATDNWNRIFGKKDNDMKPMKKDNGKTPGKKGKKC